MLPDTNVEVIVLDTDEPAITDWLPALLSAKSNATGSDTIKLNEVDRVTIPSLPETAMGKVPAGVDVVVEIVRVEEQLGLQEGTENDPLAPVGNPESEREIALLLPDFKTALIPFCAGDPFIVPLSPPFDSEKSNCRSRVNQALASLLGLELFLKAFAFTSVVAATVNAPLYCVEDWVGELPLVV